MRKALIALIICGGFVANAAKWVKWTDKSAAQPAPAKYESFEEGVPETWQLTGSGKLSLNPYHYKLGGKSLQWDFTAGDVIKVNNTIGHPFRRGRRNNSDVSCFGVWVYSSKALQDKKLTFEFYSDNHKDAYFDFYLNYTGWQPAYVGYQQTNILHGQVSAKTNNIRIVAPEGIGGQVLLDLIVYNGPLNGWYSAILPRKKPWQAKTIDSKKYPAPQTVSMFEKKGLETIKNGLEKVKFVEREVPNKWYNITIKDIGNLNITEGAHGISGKPIQVSRVHSGGEFEFYTYNGIDKKQLRSTNSVVLYICGAVRYAVLGGVTKEQYKKLSKLFVQFWKYAINQGTNTSYGFGEYYDGTYTRVSRAIYFMLPFLVDAKLIDELANYAQYSRCQLFSQQVPHMDHFAGFSSRYYLAFIIGADDIKRQVQLCYYLAKKLNTEILGDFGQEGFKVDGCGYHGRMAYDYLVNDLRPFSGLIKIINNTPFCLSDEAFAKIKKVVMRMCFYSSKAEVPLFLQGTHVFDHATRSSNSPLPEILENMALSKRGGIDRDLAQQYVNTKCFNEKYDPIFENKYGIKPSAPLHGNISMPYGPMMAQRRKDWVAVAWGDIDSDMRQRGNHYGYSLAQGPLAVLGRDGFWASGNEQQGWDWNRTPGATTHYIPDLIDVKFIRKNSTVPTGKEYLAQIMRKARQGTKSDPVIKRGNGGISWRGENGTFRIMFRGDRFYNDIQATKTYFFINDRIYALGSNICSANKKYHVQTNLYQKALYKTIPAGHNKWKKVELTGNASYVDGNKITDFPVTDATLNKTTAHYLIDPQGNGYYIPAGQKLFVARKHQKSRTTKFFKNIDHEGEFATAWFDHGIMPKNVKYCYVIFPYCDKSEFAKFNHENFAVLRQDDFAHILHDKIDNFYAGVFFKGGNVAKLPHVKKIERDCQIMYRGKGDELEIAVGDPDPHRKWTNELYAGYCGGKSELTPLKVTFDGIWVLKKAVAGVKIISSDKHKTVIEFACIHGKDFNFTLVKKR